MLLCVQWMTVVFFSSYTFPDGTTTEDLVICLNKVFLLPMETRQCWSWLFFEYPDARLEFSKILFLIVKWWTAVFLQRSSTTYTLTVLYNVALLNHSQSHRPVEASMQNKQFGVQCLSCLYTNFRKWIIIDINKETTVCISSCRCSIWHISWLYQPCARGQLDNSVLQHHRKSSCEHHLVSSGWRSGESSGV